MSAFSSVNPFPFSLFSWVWVMMVLLLAPPLSPRADEIIFKDGKKVEGVVRDSGGEEILVETAGGVFSFQRSTIDRIVKGSEMNNLLSKARVEETRQNFGEAIALYSEALRMVRSDEEKDGIVRSQRNAIQKFIDSFASHDLLTRGLSDIQEIGENSTRQRYRPGAFHRGQAAGNPAQL